MVFRREGNTIFFFLLGFKERGVWCLPKGIIEEGETELEAAEREVAEETGITDLKLVDKVGTIHYQFWYKRRRIDKTVHFYLFETNQAETRIGEEHDAYGWFKFDEAVKALTYENERKILEKAYEMIKKKGRSLLEFVGGEKERAQDPR